jgi:hypothetical protein
MAPEFWLIDEATQDALAALIDAAADSVIDNFNSFGNENSLTAALGQELLRARLDIGGTSARFFYRNFLEQTEEPITGADGGIVVTIRTREQTIKKAVLFQAKRFPQDPERPELAQVGGSPSQAPGGPNDSAHQRLHRIGSDARSHVRNRRPLRGSTQHRRCSLCH